MNSQITIIPEPSLGARVLTAKGELGTVVAILADRRIRADADRGRWRQLGHGVIVELDGGELIHVREPRYALRIAPTTSEPRQT